MTTLCLPKTTLILRTRCKPSKQGTPLHASRANPPCVRGQVREANQHEYIKFASIFLEFQYKITLSRVLIKVYTLTIFSVNKVCLVVSVLAAASRQTESVPSSVSQLTSQPTLFVFCSPGRTRRSHLIQIQQAKVRGLRSALCWQTTQSWTIMNK